MSAREVISNALIECLSAVNGGSLADRVIARLAAAGYVILSPDEVLGIRDEALEEAAKIAGDLSEQEDGAEGWLAGISIATAIRSLKGGRGDA